MSTLQPQQILVPKKVHIGDTAELRCTFASESPKLKQLTEKGTTEIPASVYKTNIDFTELEILKTTISPAGVNTYQVTVTFIPWKTGFIQVPDIEIDNITLELKPEEIVSLTEQFKTNTLKESTAPLLLPGTIYKVYGLIIGGVILIILSICLIVKRKKLNFFMKNKILQIKYKKNKKRTEKQLRKIENNKQISDLSCAESIQHILRSYLEFRFDYPFTRIVTSELVKKFNEITQMLLSDNKYEAFGEISASFIRTDFIRYSNNASFQENEKHELIENIIKNIEILEGVEDA